MIIDGKAVAEKLYEELAKERELLSREIRLGILVVGNNPVIESFIRIKTRAASRLNVEMVRVDMSESATTDEVAAAVKKLAGETDAVIAQLPFSKSIDIERVLAAIPPEKDVDAINPNIPDEKRPAYAPVALAVAEILKQSGVDPKGKRAVVVGAGRLVGVPTAALLKRMGAVVSMFTLEEGSIEDLQDADIIVSGAGNPGFIKPEQVKDGVVLIDAGASEMKGVIRGDADPACAEKASVFTPVPGGVGPIAVAMIFKNLFSLIR